MFTLLLALIVVSATLTGYLFYQARIMRQDLAAIEPEAVQILTVTIGKNRAMQEFVQQLAAYGQTHPAFQTQVLKKYGITVANSPRQEISFHDPPSRRSSGKNSTAAEFSARNHRNPYARPCAGDG